MEWYGASGSLKDRIYLYMFDRAERTGELKPGMTVLECSTGNAGIACACISAVKGYRCVIVMPDGMSEERKKLIRAYGAELVQTPGAESDVDVSLQKLAEIRRADPDRYWIPAQFDNPANVDAHYETTGPEILRDLPDIDVFVAGLGTGGTLTGVGHFLKEKKPDVKIVASVPHPGDLVQGLRALEDGFIPPILDESVLDGRIVVDSNSSFAMTKELMEKEAIFAGISSGAALKVALRVAERLDKGNVVALLADGGWKYLSTELWSKDYGEIEDVEGKIWW